MTPTCDVCGTTFQRKPGEVTRRFCSRACYFSAKTKDLATRFWTMVDKSPGQGPYGDCWEWQGYRMHLGYGQIGLDSGRVARTHRVAWMLTHGPIQPGMFIMHARCDNPPCCRPDHLQPGTSQDNQRDMAEKGRGHVPHASPGTLPKKRRLKPGETRSNVKLTEEQVRAIRQAYAAGVKTIDIAQAHGITGTHVWHVTRRNTWKHVV